MNTGIVTHEGFDMQALERLSPSARQAALRPALAHLLYLGEHGLDVTPFDVTDVGTRDAWLREARKCQRLVARLPWRVALEMAAKRMANAQGWEWPDMAGYAIRCDPTTPPAEQARHLSVARIDARQKLRYLAREAGAAIDAHLADGNAEDRPDLEQDVIDNTRALAQQDATTRRVLTDSKRSFGVIEGGLR